MFFHPIAEILGWIAVALGVVSTYIQLRRVAQLGIEGVSLATWILFAYMACFWIIYGVVARSWVVIMGSLLALPLQIPIVVRLSPLRNWRTSLYAFVFFALCCVAPTIFAGWSAGVYGTGIVMAVTRGPQTIKLIRQRHANGVSTVTWLMGTLASVLWIIYYYVDTHLWAALEVTAVGGIANLTIALLARWRHLQAQRDMVAEEVFVA